MRAGQTALLLRSGRKWRKAPDEGRQDSPSPAKRVKVARSAGGGRERSELLLPFPGAGSSQKQRVAALARPHPAFGHLLPRAGEGLEAGLSFYGGTRTTGSRLSACQTHSGCRAGTAFPPPYPLGRAFVTQDAYNAAPPSRPLPVRPLPDRPPPRVSHYSRRPAPAERRPAAAPVDVFRQP